MRLVSALYPDWYPFNVFWKDAECFFTERPADLQPGDVLIVWGGGDIHPSLYGHNKSRQSGANGEHWTENKRDSIEWKLMLRAKELKLPILGICRGAQMLCALAGGTLMQHVDGHGGSNHLVRTFDGHMLETNSIHHQMMNPAGTKHKIVAAMVSNRSHKYHHVDGDTEVISVNAFPKGEPEFIHFTAVNGFAVQWHPEMMDANAEASLYVKDYVERFI